MPFTSTGKPLSENDIREVETYLGFALPPDVREMYLTANGGIPEPYVLSLDCLDTSISRFLPLKADHGSFTASMVYDKTIRELQWCPAGFLPFAADSGGNFFFVDCSAPGSQVYFCSHESGLTDPVNLDLTFTQFWESLIEDE